MVSALALDTTDVPADTQARPANDAAVAAPVSLLHFITCGSVDDGKSTLIGRLLYEAGAVFDDQLSVLDRDSRQFGTAGPARDYALLVDGLSAEREQGITIDVAYRYFATPRRAFIVADTPGHEQYTRNMATGASNAEVAVILIDARKGLLPQTRRHSFLVSLLGVRHVIVAVNKMDLVGFDKVVFRRIASEYRQAVAGLGFASITCIPVVARDGDNITSRSERMIWYTGPALLPWLERIDAEPPITSEAGAAMPVQWVNRPSPDFRGYAGTLAAGRLAAGDKIRALPSGRTSHIARIVTADGDLADAVAGQSVTLTLTDEIDLSRGDVIVADAALTARAVNRTAARLVVTADRTLRAGDRFLVKVGAATASATIERIDNVIDIESFAPASSEGLALNAIGHVWLRFDRKLALADYSTIRDLGSLLLIDRISGETVAFGIVPPSGDGPQAGEGFAAAASARARTVRRGGIAPAAPALAPCELAIDQRGPAWSGHRPRQRFARLRHRGRAGRSRVARSVAHPP